MYSHYQTEWEKSSSNSPHSSAVIVLRSFIACVETNVDMAITNLDQDSFVILDIAKILLQRPLLLQAALFAVSFSALLNPVLKCQHQYLLSRQERFLPRRARCLLYCLNKEEKSGPRLRISPARCRDGQYNNILLKHSWFRKEIKRHLTFPHRLYLQNTNCHQCEKTVVPP